MGRRKSEYKPLLFTTTLRNPERIKLFLKILEPYDGMLLTNEVIMDIVYDLIRSKVYTTQYQKSDDNLRSILNSDFDYTLAQVKEIIKNSPQSHKEAGFDKGWPSRFETWYMFPKELGFVNYSIGKKIEISETGKIIIKSNEFEYSNLEQQAYLNAFVKYQRKNPYKRVLNDNKPLILLLSTILELKGYYGEKFSGINIKELPLFICWKDQDFKSLSKLIISTRSKYGFNPSNEVIYQICKDILDFDEEDEKRFKIETLLKELPDEFIRKMRLTGLLTLRGRGNFLDIDNLKIDIVSYIIKNYTEYKTYENVQEYFDYMKGIDNSLIDSTKITALPQNAKRKLFLKWVEEFSHEEILKELLIVCNNKTYSKHLILKYIDEPIRFEFLTAISLQQKYPNIEVLPNYIIDDEGLPTNFASGGQADIICKCSDFDTLFEVTLLNGVNQNIREMPSITRHLREYNTNEKKAFSVLVAPQIHNDTLEYSQFIKNKDNLDIIPLTIHDYLSSLQLNNSIKDYLNL